MISTILGYTLAFASVYVVPELLDWVYPFVMMPVSRLWHRRPTIGPHAEHFYLKVYYHLMWLLSGFLSALTMFYVLERFQLKFSTVFFFMYCVPLGWLLITKRLRTDTDTGYLDSFPSMKSPKHEAPADAYFRYTRFMNRTEAFTRFCGFLLAYSLFHPS